MSCTTCWFASGGDDRHCGKCDCCPESARVAHRARNRTRLLVKIRDLTPAEEREMERLIEAEQRDREAVERTRYESHEWTSNDPDYCARCGVDWDDADIQCEEIP